MTVRAETPTHRISVTPDSRLDESATAVIGLNAEFLAAVHKVQDCGTEITRSNYLME